MFLKQVLHLLDYTTII